MIKRPRTITRAASLPRSTSPSASSSCPRAGTMTRFTSRAGPRSTPGWPRRSRGPSSARLLFGVHDGAHRLFGEALRKPGRRGGAGGDQDLLRLIRVLLAGDAFGIVGQEREGLAQISQTALQRALLAP